MRRSALGVGVPPPAGAGHSRREGRDLATATLEPRRNLVRLEHAVARGVDLLEADAVAPELAQMIEHRAAARLVEQDAVVYGMSEDEAAVAGEIDVADLDVRVVPRQVVVARERAADVAIAALVMDGANEERVVAGLVQHSEQAELADEPGAQILQHEALVAVIRPGMAQGAIGVAVAGDVGEPLAILIARLEADALDVAHHGEAQGIGVDAVVARVVEIGLEDDAGVRMQRLEEGAVVDQALLVQAGHDLVMHEGRAALVHEPRLLLRVEVLRDVADDAHQLALPRLEPRRPLLEEIEDVLLGEAELAPDLRALLRPGADILLALLADEGGAPDVVVVLLEITAAILLALPLLLE